VTDAAAAAAAAGIVSAGTQASDGASELMRHITADMQAGGCLASSAQASNVYKDTRQSATKPSLGLLTGSHVFMRLA
jgi:hypothetical protein